MVLNRLEGTLDLGSSSRIHSWNRNLARVALRAVLEHKSLGYRKPASAVEIYLSLDY